MRLPVDPGMTDGAFDMQTKPLVSIIIIFLNEADFLKDAVESVLAQTYEQWELFLVDDGSSDRSTSIARAYSAQDPAKIYYLEHSGHKNLGMSASRNLGIQYANGKYLAFLDADDVWLPHKLQEQVALFEANSEAGMLFGQSLYWYSWTQRPEDNQRDCVPVSGISSNTLIQPPHLLPLFLRGKLAVPCPTSIMVKRSVMANVGGFVETFVGRYSVYEDQAFFSKISLQTSVLVCNDCWDRYRQHATSSTAVSQKSGQAIIARRFFLGWLRSYLQQQGVTDAALWQAVRREVWRIHHPAWLPNVAPLPYLNRWVKKWLLRLEERVLPSILRDWLWIRK
jgi:glycosyltransferase involved in cell wall biosynthesis